MPFVDALNQNPKVKAWQWTSIKKKSVELYAIFDSIETLRYNQTENNSVVLNTFPLLMDENIHGETRLDFEKLPTDNWQTRIEKAVKRSAFGQNPVYSLSKPWQYKGDNPSFFEQTTIENESQGMEQIEQLYSVFQRAQKKLHCHAAANEFFLSTYQTHYQNSKKLYLSFPSTQILWDFVLLSPNQQKENHVIKKARSIDLLKIEETLFNEEKLLLSSLEATLPPTGKMSVVLADEALDTIFDFFSKQTSAAALYHKYGLFAKGNSVFEHEPLEPLWLRSDPQIIGNLSFVFFDELGFPIAPVDLIENNIVKNFSIDGKFSAYLNLPMTSAFTTTVVKNGTFSYDSFLENNTLEILRLSTFQPNPISGDFSGEIRFAYLHKNGKKIPIKGGSVTGSSRKDFLKARYAKETELRSNYFGPKGIWFENLTIAGE